MSTEAAIDANAPLQDDLDNNGPVDSDEERDSVMAAITRSAPQPLATHSLITTKKKYKYVRVKEQMLHAMGGRSGGSQFSTDDSQPLFGGNIFQPFDPNVASSSPIVSVEESNAPSATPDTSKKTPIQTARKAPVAAAS